MNGYYSNCSNDYRKSYKIIKRLKRETPVSSTLHMPVCVYIRTKCKPVCSVDEFNYYLTRRGKRIIIIMTKSYKTAK